MSDDLSNDATARRLVPNRMTDDQWLDLNDGVIDEFRSRHGHCSGRWEGNPMLLLTTIGAKSGAERTSPLTYTRPHDDDDALVLIASKAGADSHPAWYHNLLANPEVTIEIAAGEIGAEEGIERYRAAARVAEEPERSRLFDERIAVMPRFGDYVTQTGRTIPVVVVERLRP